MNTERKFSPARVVAVFTENFGLSWALSLIMVSFISLVACLAIYWFIHSAPPSSLTITSGPPGSPFENNAEKYRAILARNGVTLHILPSQGSLENLQRLGNPGSGVDIGFVQGGISDGTNAREPVLLGNISYEPLLVFYRSGTNITLLSGLAGKRLAIGAVGSGSHSLAMILLQTNGLVDDGATRLLDLDADAAAQALLAGTVDAVFMMSDSASAQTMRTLLRSPGIQLLSLEQADAYARRFSYLNKLLIPEGAIDLGKNLPRRDVWLVGPTVELLARPDLNPAISDLLLEAAREVHGKASILQNKGEFPNPVEHDFKISPDASRYYKSGKTFLYRELPFWIASLLNRILVAFIPMVIVLVPGMRLIATAYRWRMQLRLHRWYRTLLALERELARDNAQVNRADMRRRLDEVETAVKHMKMPASFADRVYSLRGHVDYVREKLAGIKPA
jgi:TRAP-type uncharacterized transport system substrate-binding protein